MISNGLLGIALLFAALALVTVIFGVVRIGVLKNNGAANNTNRLMRWRVGLQACAVVSFGVALLLRNL